MVEAAAALQCCAMQPPHVTLSGQTGEARAHPRRLAVGTYTGAIELGGDGIPVAILPVTMTVAPATGTGARPLR